MEYVHFSGSKNELCNYVPSSSLPQPGGCQATMLGARFIDFVPVIQHANWKPLLLLFILVATRMFRRWEGMGEYWTILDSYESRS